MMHLFIGHAQGRPLSASKLARIAEMPRTTVLRRLTALIELGYLERISNSYYLTAKSNVPNQRRILLEHIGCSAILMSCMCVSPLASAKIRRHVTRSSVAFAAYETAPVMYGSSGYFRR